MKNKAILSLTLYFTLVGCSQDNHSNENQQQQQQQQITNTNQNKNYSYHSANNIPTQTVISYNEDSLNRIELAQAEEQAITNDLSGSNNNNDSSSLPVNEMSGGTRIPETSSSNIPTSPNSDIPPSDPSSPTTPGVPSTAKTPLPDSPPSNSPSPSSASDSNTLGVGNASSHQFKGNLDNLPKPVIISPPDSGTNSSKKSLSLNSGKPLAENLSSQSSPAESSLKETNTEQPPVTIQLMERKAEQAPQSFVAEIKALKQEIKELKQWAYNK